MHRDGQRDGFRSKNGKLFDTHARLAGDPAVLTHGSYEDKYMGQMPASAVKVKRNPDTGAVGQSQFLKSHVTS